MFNNRLVAFYNYTSSSLFQTLVKFFVRLSYISLSAVDELLAMYWELVSFPSAVNIQFWVNKVDCLLFVAFWALTTHLEPRGVKLIC